MKVVITAPSLDEHKNVSGISTIVRQIIEHGSHDFSHFKAGREDGEAANAVWLAKQATLPVGFTAKLISEKADLVDINTALTDLSIWRDLALSKAAKLAGRPIVLALHGGKYLVNPIENSRVAAAVESMLRSAKIVVVYSELERQAVEERWKGLDIRVLANAIPVRSEPIAERNNIVPQIIFFGRLHESKGLGEMVTACRQLADDGVEFKLNCYGDGPMKDEFLADITAAIGERFFYGGVLKSSEKYSVLDNSDIFLLPSIYGEGLPMAILEAMAAGCVVVASEMASVASVIKNGVNGYMVEPRNTEQLVARLKNSLTDRSKWQPIREAAVATVQNDFAIEGYIAKLDAIYADAIK
jgi:glycosyltransferase involved in cell wall biosynthesis